MKDTRFKTKTLESYSSRSGGQALNLAVLNLIVLSLKV
jgi:hypothetical protein